MTTLPWYTTREDVKAALDIKETARNNVQVDRAIESASRTVEGYLHRKFYPLLTTKYFDWPNLNSPISYRLWLDGSEVVSVSTLVAGSTTIVSADYFLEPFNYGPPYDRIEIDLSATSAFDTGDTHQRDIAVTGIFGYDNVVSTAGTLSEALDSSETAVDVSNSYAIGVGDLITVESEKMIVTGKTMIDTTQNLGGSGLTASNSDVTVPVSSGSSFAVGETILIDAEKMLIVDIAANNLIVKRAWDGSTLATHSTSADIYAPRTLTVERGSLGTTAAAHDTATAINRQVYPGPVKNLVTAEALNILLSESSGYARIVGEGDNSREASGRGLYALRKQVRTSHGRMARLRVV